jgi:hypothetical protein
MTIVEALGGKFWFNMYAGSMLGCLIVIAINSFKN